MQPDFVVIDSIQTIYHADVTSAPVKPLTGARVYG